MSPLHHDSQGAVPGKCDHPQMFVKRDAPRTPVLGSVFGAAMEHIEGISVLNYLSSLPNYLFLFQIDHHFHYLDIQAIESKQPNEVWV